ncbi:multidrug ABC transporter permease [Sulfolobus acidocaldarius SUSAZ]|nr:multidrug ABC transporter permease [Sulfolobus acidocaldarius SUSAZ]
MSMFELELRRIMHDRTELYIRAAQPIFWLIIYGTIIARTRAILVGIPYIDYITPGVIMQSTVFVSVFYGLTLVWERESGILKRLITTPSPRYAIIIGRSLASGVRGLFQLLILVPIALLLGVRFYSPLFFIATIPIIIVISSGFASLSVIIASFMKTRERFMGIGQAMILPLFFSSNALYPLQLMPKVLQYVAIINPMTYGVNLCRSFMITGNFSSTLIDILVAILFDAVMYIIASLRFRKIIE